MNTVPPDPSLPSRIATASWAFCLTAKTRCQRDSTDLQTLGWLKTIHAIMCTFFFSPLLQEQRQRQLECKHRDGSLIALAKTKRHQSPFAEILLCCTPAKSNSTRSSSITYPSLKTINASQLCSLKFRNPLCLLLVASLPSFNEHSWSSRDFTVAMLTAYWVTTPFVVWEKNNFWKCNGLHSQSLPALSMSY